MKILVIGGTRFMGVHLVTELLLTGHDVTIATRGLAGDTYGDHVKRIVLDRTDPQSVQKALAGLEFDVIFDHLAYCSSDVKHLLDVVTCKRYIAISSAAVYENLHLHTKENEFDPAQKALIYGARRDFDYGEGKRQAECALTQAYPHVPSAMVRLPFVIGEDDYTNRLYFYVEHIVREIPMYIDNLQAQMAFVTANEAGKFLAFLAEQTFCGAINGANQGTISLGEVAAYVKLKTGKEILLRECGDAAPYNGTQAYSIHTEQAAQLGFVFSPLDREIYTLLDRYIATCNATAETN